jgi:hypothetical protein
MSMLQDNLTLVSHMINCRLSKQTDSCKVHWATTCFILLFIIVGLCDQADADEKLKERFFSEYPAAAVHAKRFYQGLSVRLRERTMYKGNPEPDMVFEHVYKTANGRASLQTNALKRLPEMEGLPSSKAIVAHPRLSFSVRKEQDSDEWVLNDVREYLQASGFLGLDAPGVVAPYVINSVEITDLFRDKDFMVTGAEWVIHADKRMARINFDWDQSRGWLLLSPDESWIMYGFLRGSKDESQAQTAYQHAEITYQPSGEPLPWLKQARYWVEVKNHVEDRVEIELAYDNTFDVVEIERQDVPEHEFTLAAFGLPEPGETPHHRRRLVITTVVVAVFLTAFCVFWLTRKRQPRAA